MLSNLFETILTVLWNAGLRLVRRSPKAEGIQPVAAQAQPGDVLIGHMLHDAPEQPGVVPMAVPVILRAEERRLGTYLFGPPGAGKTNCLMTMFRADISAILNGARRNVFAIDVAGDWFDAALAHMAEMAPPEVWAPRFFPYDWREESWVMPFNPLTVSDDVSACSQSALSIIKNQVQLGLNAEMDLSYGLGQP